MRTPARRRASGPHHAARRWCRSWPRRGRRRRRRLDRRSRALTRRRRSAGRVRSRASSRPRRSAASVDRRERGIAVIPDPPERADELLAAGQVDRNKVRHGQKATVTAVNRWILGARPRTLPAAVVPVAIGAGAAVGGPSPVWWRVGAGADRQPGPADRGQLRQRLQRWCSRNRRRACRAGSAGRRRAGQAVTRSSGCVRRVRCRRVSPGWCWRPPRRWWLIVVGRLAMLAGWGYTGGPEAVRVPRSRRVVRVRVLRTRRDRRHAPMS